MRPSYGNLKTLFYTALMLPSTLLAQDFSPFSPAFILEDGVVQSSTSLGVNWYNGQSSTPTSNDSQKISIVSGGEFLSVGLPYDTQVGIGVAYSDWVSKSPSSLNVSTQGFSSPSLFARKVWFGDTDKRLNLNLSAIPDTKVGISSTSYSAGLTGVFVINHSRVISLGASQYMYTQSGPLLPSQTQLSGTLSQSIGLYLFNFSLAASRSNSQLVNQGYKQAGFGLRGGIQLSRQFATNVWGAISYDISGNNSTYVYGASDYKNKNLNNSLLTTVNILF